MKAIIQFTFMLAIMFVCLVLIALIVTHRLDAPIVHFSHSTGECVEVLSKSGDYHCDNLPEKYTHVWVR